MSGPVFLHYGSMPIDMLSKASKACGPGAVMSPDVARMAGANIAAGTPEALAQIRKALTAGAIQRILDEYADKDLSFNQILWLATGERGTSSNTLFSAATGVDVSGDNRSHPRDMDDFRRCRLLVEACPQIRAALSKVGAESKEWAEIVSFWDDICVLQDLENPEWRVKLGKAPQAESMLQDLINRHSEKKG